jgi:hypothetical protein
MVVAYSKLGHNEPLAVCLNMSALLSYRVLQIANRTDIADYCQIISYFLFVLLCFVMILPVRVLYEMD